MTNLGEKLITLDPRDESDHGPALLATRPPSLNGKTLGLLSFRLSALSFAFLLYEFLFFHPKINFHPNE